MKYPFVSPHLLGSLLRLCKALPVTASDHRRTFRGQQPVIGVKEPPVILKITKPGRKDTQRVTLESFEGFGGWSVNASINLIAMASNLIKIWTHGLFRWDLGCRRGGCDGSIADKNTCEQWRNQRGFRDLRANPGAQAPGIGLFRGLLECLVDECLLW